MSAAPEIDAARLPIMLTNLRLPTIGKLWPAFAAQADKEGWGSARFLAALLEHELAARDQRRIARHLLESGLRRERHSRISTSPPCPPFARRR